jgi:hypothetical protein
MASLSFSNDTGYTNTVPRDAVGNITTCQCARQAAAVNRNRDSAPHQN